MKIFDKMIVREFIPQYFICQGILIFVLIVNRIFELVNLLIGKGVDIRIVGELFINTLPFIIFLTIPMSVLVASIMTFGRMSNDFEITAMNACGLNSGGLVIKMLIFSSILFIIALFFADFIVPDANHRVKIMISGISRMKPSVNIEQGIVKKSYDSDLKFYFEHIDKDGTFNNVRIFEKDRTITAPSGNFLGENKGKSYVLLNEGQIIENEGNKTDIIKFNSMVFGLKLEEDIKESTTGRGDREMTTAMLLNEIQKTKDKSQESDNIYQKHRTKRRIYRYLVEINKKFSIAFGVYGFILLGSVIGISLRKSGMGVGFGISTILFVIYYIILVLGEQFSDKGLISPYITMWIPNIITMLFGFLMFYFTLMRMPPKIFSKIKSIGRNKNEDS